MNFRVGFGFDVHPLETGPKLVIGGVDISWHKGCSGHSDGDVLIHAICDAMLGAAGAGDIGTHFPDTSKEYKGIDSRILLGKTKDIIRLKGYQLAQIDSTVCLEKPKIASYIPQMARTLADVLETDPGNISVKATTTERLGFVGREEGVAAYAVVLLEKVGSGE
jgi:2-C-methyl-D-erythritol 2,4-cyclodiphosphate synthase